MENLGDIRLIRVKDSLLDAMQKRQSVVIRQISKNRSEEIRYGRYVNNKHVTPQGILSSQVDLYGSCCSGKHVLIIEDTSTMSFGFQSNRSMLGYVGKSKSVSGFYMHPGIGVDADNGGYLGLFGLQIWQRPAPPTLVVEPNLDEASQKKLQLAFKKAQRKDLWKTPFEEKEYYKWYSVAEQAVSNSSQAAQHTIISDREGDVYEAICGYQGKGWDYIVRSSYDRKLSPLDSIDNKVTEKTLHKAIETWEIQGSYSLDLPKTDKRSAHTAHIDLKFGQVAITCPNWTVKQEYPKSSQLYVVEVKEQPTTVINGEKPIHWILLTSHAVQSVEEALTIVKWYRWRWFIEQTFRTLKSKGLDIESSEAESYEALINLATMALLAAVLIMQLVQARDGNTQQNIQDIFTPIEIQCLEQLSTQLEGKTEKQKNPYPKNSLAFASWVIARLVGWSGYTVYRPPGPSTMKNGLTRFFDILQGFKLNL